MRGSRYAWRLAAIAGATGALFGYDISSTNDALAFMQSELDLDSLDKGVVVSALLFGALVGALCAGRLADVAGRKRTILIAGGVAAVGALVQAAASSLELLIAGRLVTGFAVGVTSAIAPVYVAELAPPERRGAMVALYQLSITLGILAALAVGVVFTPTADWRVMIAVGAVPAIAQLLAMVGVPESPRLLVARGRIDEARAVLERLRPPDVATREIDAIVAADREHADDPEPGYRDLIAPRYRRAVIVGVGAAMMNALVGVGSVIYYSTSVFQTAGLVGATGAEIASLVVGVVNTLMTLVAVVLIGRYPRRALLMVGLAGIVGSLVLTGVTLMLSSAGAPGWLTLVGIVLFIASFAISAGPIAWLIVSEVFPLAIRGRAASVAAGTNWGCNLLLALLFPVVAGTPSDPARVGAAFLVYAVLSAGFFVFVKVLVPETKGRTLEEIEAELAPATAAR